jgi:FkbM family methyltransferase
LYWSRPDTFLPHYSVAHPDGVRNEKPGVRAGAALFKDACSQQEFLAQLQWRLDAEANPLDTADAEPIYFCESLYSLQADEVYVDCGGFDGDTLRAFYEATHGKIGKAFVFEPDPLNFKKLCATIATFPAQERARVKAYPNAVGRKSEILTFESIGTVASQVSATGSIRVQCEPLDKILEGEKITYLKMDIEGAEPDAIEGAEMLIRRSRPILAVCLYHRQNHLWTIPLKINSFVEDYEFYLRSHDKDGWDLVLYGVPAERRKRGQPA